MAAPGKARARHEMLNRMAPRHTAKATKVTKSAGTVKVKKA
jgi:hypothetical protein